MTPAASPTRVAHRGIVQAARAAGSLLLHTAAALTLIVALEPALRARTDLTALGMAEARGIGLAVALVTAVLIWTALGFLPRRSR